MKIAITGGTGFVGRHLALKLIAENHEVVLISRGLDGRDPSIREKKAITFMPIGLTDEDKLVDAFKGCDAIAHCAGINREIKNHTYERIHVQGTLHVVNAARKANVEKISLLSFLRARPSCGSKYHESKWTAEEIVRKSGLNYTILKAGVIYGTGDHMLDHLSHAFYTFPIFGLVGFKDQMVRPVAVEDVVKILYHSLIRGRLPYKTVAVTGPDEMTLKEAVQRVAKTVGKMPLMFPMPLWFHYGLGYVCEKIMTIPLISIAQVKILSEGVVQPLPFAEALPDELVPQIHFTEDQIKKGLPEAKAFGCRDFYWGEACI